MTRARECDWQASLDYISRASVRCCTQLKHPSMIRSTVSSSFCLRWPSVNNPYLPILRSSLLSVVVLINDHLHRAVVGRHFLRDNLRYIDFHLSTGDYSPSTGIFFLPPTSIPAISNEPFQGKTTVPLLQALVLSFHRASLFL